MSSQFGTLFRVATFGESHGGGVGAVIDGCPPRIPLTEEDIQPALDRRRPGQSEIVTPRDEADRCEILSGTCDGVTLGTPIALLVQPSGNHRVGPRRPLILSELPPETGRLPRFEPAFWWVKCWVLPKLPHG